MDSQTALLVVDVQNGIIAGEQPAYRSDRVLENIARLLAEARTAAVPVVFVQHSDPWELPIGSHNWEIHPAVAPLSGEPVIAKRASDSFFETALQAELDKHGVEHLVVVGCQTNFCVDTTSRRATTLGYNVTLVEDAHTTSDWYMPAEQIVGYHNAILNGFGVLNEDGSVRTGIRVLPTAQVQF